jgi:hypothetical protein
MSVSVGFVEWKGGRTCGATCKARRGDRETFIEETPLRIWVGRMLLCTVRNRHWHCQQISAEARKERGYIVWQKLCDEVSPASNKLRKEVAVRKSDPCGTLKCVANSHVQRSTGDLWTQPSVVFRNVYNNKYSSVTCTTPEYLLGILVSCHDLRAF